MQPVLEMNMKNFDSIADVISKASNAHGNPAKCPVCAAVEDRELPTMIGYFILGAGKDPHKWTLQWGGEGCKAEPVLRDGSGFLGNFKFGIGCVGYEKMIKSLREFLET